MNGDVTDWLVAQWLNSFTPAWFGLHIANPGRIGDIHTEVVGGSYQRVQGVFGPFDARTVWLSNQLTWTGLPACVVTYIGVWDAQYNGHLLSYGLLPGVHSVGQGQSLVLDANTYAISVGLSS